MGVKSIVAGSVVTVMLVVRASSLGGAAVSGLDRLSQRFDHLRVIDGASGGRRVAYADARGHVHVYRYESGKPVLAWETTTLGSPASGLFVEDVEKDGTVEIVVTTADGRILFFDADSYELVWDNRDDPFDNIRCVLIEDIDRDPQREIVFVTGAYLVVFDSVTKVVEWRSEGFSEVREMVVGNVDDDEQQELVLSSGVVIDTQHHGVEFESEEPFGDRIDLLDLTGDGVSEVIGEGRDSKLRVFDVHRARELW